MTREEARKAAEVMLAYADGKKIEYKNSCSKWESIDNPIFNWEGHSTYRIKSTSTYRPFDNAKECWEEMKKHEPFGWMKCEDRELYVLIRDVRDSEGCVVVGYGACSSYNADMIMKAYTFADGTPFGKLIKENE